MGNGSGDIAIAFTTANRVPHYSSGKFLSMSVPWLISGYIIIEKIFGIPGMGNLMITSIVQQDFNVIQAIIMIITFLTVICNILSDIVLGILDPRIRISVTGGDN